MWERLADAGGGVGVRPGEDVRQPLLEVDAVLPAGGREAGEGGHRDAAALVAAAPKKSFEECVSMFLRAHCSLLGIRKSSDERLEPARDYSLEGLNIKSGIRPERII